LQINRSYAEMGKALLLHEMTHVYMFDRRSRERTVEGYDDGWFQESLASYVPMVLGVEGAGRPLRGDPTEGYSKGARFLFWVEANFPGSVGATGRRMIEGDDPFIAFSEETGQPIAVLLAAYEKLPNIPHANGPFARYLQPPKMTREQRKARDEQLARIQIVDWQLAAGATRRKYGGWNDFDSSEIG
jgi:hypothetical protein